MRKPNNKEISLKFKENEQSIASQCQICKSDKKIINVVGAKSHRQILIINTKIKS